MALLWKFYLALSLVFASGLCRAQDVIFEKGKIKLAGKTLAVELAESRVQHERGLMNRQALSGNEGMLFVFPDEETRYFWMKNTIIDLSIGYFDKNKTLIDMQEMAATSMMDEHPPAYPSAKPAMYALEMSKGWFTKNKIKLGQKFEFIKH